MARVSPGGYPTETGTKKMVRVPLYNRTGQSCRVGKKRFPRGTGPWPIPLPGCPLDNKLIVMFQDMNTTCNMLFCSMPSLLFLAFLNMCKVVA